MNTFILIVMNFYSNDVQRIQEILKLVEYIPIRSNIPNNGKFMDNTTIDSEFYFESLNRKSSFRDIVRMLNAELSKTTADWQNILFFERRYNQ